MKTINVGMWYRRFECYIDLKYLILLVLADLHYNKKITDEKFKGQMSALRKGTLQRHKGTYHCTITDRWFNDESAYEVFLDCLEIKGSSLLPFDVFIKYIQEFENKNYNYALNVFGSEYIYRMFNQWNPEGYVQDFPEFIEFDIPNIYISDTSCTCDYCGCTQHNVDKNSYHNIKVISEWLHSMKKGNKDKIPFHLIDNVSPWI